MWILTVKYDECILMSHFLAHSLASTGSSSLSLLRFSLGLFFFFYYRSHTHGTWERVFLDGKLIATPLEFGRVAPRLEGAVLSAVTVRIRKGRLSVAEESSSPGDQVLTAFLPVYKTGKSSHDHPPAAFAHRSFGSRSFILFSFLKI